MKQTVKIKIRRRVLRASFAPFAPNAGASLRLVPETARAMPVPNFRDLRLSRGIKEIVKALAVPSTEVAAHNTGDRVMKTAASVNTNNSRCKDHHRRCIPHQHRLHALLPLVTLPIATAVICTAVRVTHINLLNNTHSSRNIPY